MQSDGDTQKEQIENLEILVRQKTQFSKMVGRLFRAY
jgi:hypothetical protein